MELNVTEYLRQFSNKNIIYVPNSGNAGDALISYATLQLFDKLNLTYTIGDKHKCYENKIIIYGGGGNLIPAYVDCKDFLYTNHSKNDITVLPHSIYGCDELLKIFGNNITFFCREPISYNYLQNINNHKYSTFLDHDMSFLTKVPSVYFNNSCLGVANCFREDVEKTAITLPVDNKDYSMIFKFMRCTSTKKNIKISAKLLLRAISKFHTINTNRLHIAIAGALLGKTVNMYNNSYYKNKAIFEYSIKYKYNSVFFHE